MPFVIFVCPQFSENSSRMVEAAGRLPGVTLGVISMAAQAQAPDYARAVMHAHWQVDSILDAGQLAWAVDGLSRIVGQRVQRIFGAYEQAQEPIAEVRAALGIAGMLPPIARQFRDKALMKDVLRAHGLPCARHRLVRSVADAEDASRLIGYPLVVKPPAGAGSIATFRVETDAQLAAALAAAPPTPQHPVLMEEFIVGTEHSLETISIGGRAVWHSLTHYRPMPLEVVRNPWIQWCVLLPREVDDPLYDDIKTSAQGALRALGMETGLSHMEWFRRRDGSVAIGEVGARPPGAQITTLVSRANDIDFVQAWARLMIFDQFDPPVRKYAVGAAFLRGQGQGAVRNVQGVEDVAREIGGLVCDYKLPHLGQLPTGSYEGEGYIIVRHPETAVVEQALLRIIDRIRVELA